MTTAPAVQTTEPLTHTTRLQLPSWRVVLLEQLRVTGFALRLPTLVVAALAVAATIMIVARVASRGMHLDFGAQPSMLYGLVGAVLPILVWARDKPFGSGFLWTLPVDRRQHALTKVLAGWLWLMAGVAISMLWLLALALLSGGRVLPAETLLVLITHTDIPRALDPTMLRTVDWNPGLLIAAVPFTAATACYLIVSAFVLGSRHPLRWVIGAVLAFAFASFASHVATTQLGMEWLANAPERALQTLFGGRYGLDALLTAQTATLDDGVTLSTGRLVSVWSAVPDLRNWGIATVLWTAAGLVALWAAASRHRERRPA